MADKAFRITKEHDFVSNKKYYVIRYFDGIYGFFGEGSLQSKDDEGLNTLLEFMLNDAYTLGKGKQDDFKS
jgi:hypothetical protein